jgi:serine/threonine protein kinase
MGSPSHQRAVKIEKKRDMRSVKQESKILKKLVELQCPLIVEPYDHGSSEDRFYLIMELLGPNLAEAKKDLFAASGVKGVSGGLPPSVVRPIGLCMLSALEGMHMAGFLHRDVKPAK